MALVEEERENMQNNDPPVVKGLPLSHCSECGLYNKSFYKPHNSTGSLTAKIVFVGEAPGAMEQKTGKAFQGRSGQNLRADIEAAGLNPDTDCFITNTCLCRPQDNRDPEPEEIACCAENLDHILKTIKPMIIMTLGIPALKRLTGFAKMGDHRGSIIKNNYGTVIPTWHPAYALRNPSVRETIRSDIQFAIDTLKGKKQVKNLDYWVATSIPEFDMLIDRLAQAPKYSCDIETTGLKYYAEDKIIGIGFSWRRQQGIYIPLLVKYDDMKGRINSKEYGKCPEIIITKIKKKNKKRVSYELKVHEYWGDQQHYIIDRICDILENDAYITGHLFTFDTKFLEHPNWAPFRNLKIKNWAFDSISAHYLLDENSSHALKPIVDIKYPDLRGYSEALHNLLTKIEKDEQNYSKIPLKIIATYCCGDVDASFRLAQDLGEELQAQPKLNHLMYSLYMPMNRAYADMESKGALIDWDYVKIIQEFFEKERDEKAEKIFKMAKVEPFNVGSTQQLAKVLFDHLKMPILERSAKTGIPSTKAEIMLKLAEKYPICRTVISFRFLAKMISTYFIGAKDWISKDGRVHYTYNNRLVTGRLSAKKFAIQTLPRDPRVRTIVIAPPGYKIIGPDYSQIELRFLAWYAKDQVMLEEFQNDVDIHMNTAVDMWHKDPKDITNDERKKAKLLNFGAPYGGSAETIMGHVNEKLIEEEEPITIETVEIFLQYFFSKYIGIKQWIDQVIRTAHRNKQVVSCWGRVRRLPDIDSDNRKAVSEAERQAVNSLIQGSASDLLQYANIDIKHYIKTEDKETSCLYTIHDALYEEAPDNEIEEMTYITDKFMTMPRQPIEDLPLKVDMSVSQRWKPIPKSIIPLLKSKGFEGPWE